MRPLRALDSDRVIHRPEPYPHRGVSPHEDGQLWRARARHRGGDRRGSDRRGTRATGVTGAGTRSRGEPGNGVASLRELAEAGIITRRRSAASATWPRAAPGRRAVPARRRHLPAGRVRRPGAAPAGRRGGVDDRAGRGRRLGGRARGPADGTRGRRHGASLAHVGHLQRAVRARRGRRRAPGAAVEPRGRSAGRARQPPSRAARGRSRRPPRRPPPGSAPAPARCSTA